MSVVFNMNAVSVLPTRVQADGSQLTHALAAADTDAFILDGDYPGFVGGHPSDGWFHAVIRDTTRKEIVKVNVAGSSRAAGLQVERGQQGTQAVNWQPGAAIYQDITASDLDNMLQKEVFRTIDYVPDGVLVPDYRGEKAYQSDLQLWWKAVDGVNTYWRLIAGTIVTAAPTFSNPAGSYPMGAVVELSTTTPGATIYYTTDGTTPTDASTEYTGEIAIGDFTIRAIAYGPERYYTPSSVASAVYVLYLYSTETPVLSLAAGAYSSGTTVEITCATPGSTIYYTTDGSDPTDADTAYSAPIAITSGFTLKAIAYGLDGFYEPSDIASAAYTVLGYTFTEIGSYDFGQTTVFNGRSVCVGGGYLFVAKQLMGSVNAGISAFTCTGAGLSHAGSLSSAIEHVYGLYHDGTYLYAAVGLSRIDAYSFDGAYFHLEGSVACTSAIQICGYGNYIFTCYGGQGKIEAWTFNGSVFTKAGELLRSAAYLHHTNTDGTYIYSGNPQTGYADRVGTFLFDGANFSTYAITPDVAVYGSTYTAVVVDSSEDKRFWSVNGSVYTVNQSVAADRSVIVRHTLSGASFVRTAYSAQITRDSSPYVGGIVVGGQEIFLYFNPPADATRDVTPYISISGVMTPLTPFSVNETYGVAAAIEVNGYLVCVARYGTMKAYEVTPS